MRKKRSAQYGDSSRRLIRKKRDDDMLAFGKPATQSSNYGRFVAWHAVDGNLNTIASTNSGGNSYWKVFLGDIYVVTKIVVYVVGGGKKGNPKWFNNVKAIISLFEQCGSMYKGPAKEYENVTFTCGEYGKGIEGETVILSKTINEGYLQSREVRVFGKKAAKPEELPPTLKESDTFAVLGSEIKPSIQIEADILAHSGTLRRIELGKTGFRTEASSRSNHQRAVDGLLKPDMCTDKEKNPWWIVDLYQIYSISMVKIISPINGHSKHFHDIEVFAGIRLDKFKLCNTYKGPPKKQYTSEEFLCKDSIIVGQFVKITMTTKLDHMCMSEVFIYEKQ